MITVRGSSLSAGYHKRRSGDQRRLTRSHTPCLFRLSAWDSRIGHAMKVMLKLKPRDFEVLDVGEEIARPCSPKLGNAYAEFRGSLEFVKGDRRELAVYRQRDWRFTGHAPRFLGAEGRALLGSIWRTLFSRTRSMTSSSGLSLRFTPLCAAPRRFMRYGWNATTTCWRMTCSGQRSSPDDGDVKLVHFSGPLMVHN